MALLVPVVLVAFGGLAGADHPAQSHEQAVMVDLAPGENATYNATFSGGSILRQRWLFFITATVVGEGTDQVDFALESPNGTEVARWNWAVDGEPHTEVTELPVDGFYNLSVTNDASSLSSVNVTFQFDQSCECIGKWLDMAGVVIVFQDHYEVGDEVFWAYHPGNNNFEMWAAVRNQSQPLEWDTGFETVAVQQLADTGYRYVRYTAEEEGTHYFFIRGLVGSGLVVPDNDVRLIESADNTEPAEEDEFQFPGEWIAASIFLVLGLLFLFLRVSGWGRNPRISGNIVPFEEE